MLQAIIVIRFCWNTNSSRTVINRKKILNFRTESKELHYLWSKVWQLLGLQSWRTSEKIWKRKLRKEFRVERQHDEKGNFHVDFQKIVDNNTSRRSYDWDAGHNITCQSPIDFVNYSFSVHTEVAIFSCS